MAFAATVAAEAAARQGKFWEMHDVIFGNQETLEKEDILLFAGSLGLDVPRFEKDMQEQALIGKAEGDFESGIRSGVNRTPTFFINGKKYEGDWSDGGCLYPVLNAPAQFPKRRSKRKVYWDPYATHQAAELQIRQKMIL